MSFSFNTNLDALTAINNLNTVNSSLSTSIARLSSGLRINSPADDPAGFVISNQLQTQVDGLNQAISNTQNAVNLVKTATGSLSQVTSLLNQIRSSALDAAANVVSNPLQAQADQTNIQQALNSINNIATNTQYGSTNLLNGTAGISASVTNSSVVGGLNFGGSFAGGITQAGNVTITVVAPATYAQVSGGTAATYASVNASIALVNGGNTGTGGSVTINGQSVTVSGSDTVQTLINRINNLSNSTGVVAGYITANGSVSITLTQQNYGSNYKINESESSALVLGTVGTAVAGLNATVTVTAPVLVNGAVTTAVVTFVGGRSSTDSGLRVSDIYGDSILLTAAGNTTATSSVRVGSISSNPLQFQVGANTGQTATISLPNVSTANLGGTSVAGQNLSTIDVSTLTGANNAVLIANEALNSVNQNQAQLGSFQKNVLQPSLNVMNITVQNLSSSISSISDANVAQEALNFTNKQIIQQAGVDVLYRAEQSSSLYLKLLQ